MTNVSMSLVNMLYNTQLLKLEGENGVAAYGVIMYVNLIFLSIFIGYSIGSAPIFGYNYGAENHQVVRIHIVRHQATLPICGSQKTSVTL